MESWILRNKNYNIENQNNLNICNRVLKILINRGFSSYDQVKSYLYPDISFLKDEKLLKDFNKTVEVLINFVETQDKVRIVGDYDVDGIVSVYILYRTFKDIGLNCDYVIPDRIKDGYGINKDIVKKAKDDGVKLIITCDNGIAAREAVDFSNELGILVIVTDHHDIPFEEVNGVRTDVLPNAYAILNPKQKDCKYEFKKICGAGVSFKLCKFLYEYYNMASEAMKLLEFVAIATICDVVDLEDENRFFVKYGTNLLRNSNHNGLNAIIEVNNIEKKNIGSYEIGYIIGPCLNALGRLDSATKGIELLLCQNEKEAKNLAMEVKNLNEKRKNMTIEGIGECVNIIETNKYDKDKIIVIYNENIHESIAGIIAGRIKEKYYKPTIVLTKGEDICKGSARSIENVNIFEALFKEKDLLLGFGGHPMAAGLSISEENIDVLRERLNSNCENEDGDFNRVIYLDIFCGVENIDIKFLEDIKKLEPYGKANERPILGDKKVRVCSLDRIGKNKNYLSLKISSRNNKIFNFLYFGDADEFDSKFIEKYGKDSLKKMYITNIDMSSKCFIDILYEVKIETYNFCESIKYFLYKYRF